MRDGICLYFVPQMYNIYMQQIQKKIGPLKTVFFKDGVQDGRQNIFLLIEYMHMVYGQLCCTYSVYLVVILHVSSIHHIKYVLFFGL